MNSKRVRARESTGKEGESDPSCAMNERYDFEAIETKWQERWAHSKEFAVQENSAKPKYYVLEMLPYPSGVLHLGHVRNYSLGDSVARFKRMRGFNVLHPIGWDAFGLPAENAAIAHNIPPERWTADNIARMKRQCLRMGWSYDWAREIATCEPEYYHWNQWFFVQMYKRGLAFKVKGTVNWCDNCKTVLANEQVVNGRCWRDESVVVQRKLDQWYWKITGYAEELLQDLDQLEDWPEKVLVMQRNWIGKSVGAQIRFQVANSQGLSIDIFTTRLDTIFGATFIVLSPEHELVENWLNDPIRGGELADFVDEVSRQDRMLRTAEGTEKRGVFTGSYAVNPFNQEKIPIWVANFVLIEYGMGAIMGVPAHDQRDFEFSQKYCLPIRFVVQPVGDTGNSESSQPFLGYGKLVASGPFSGFSSEEAQKKMADFARSQGFGKESISYRIRDWGISRQRYWGSPIPIVYCNQCGVVPVPEDQLPVRLPRLNRICSFREFYLSGGSPLANIPEFLETSCPSCDGIARRETDTMDTFVDSSWYFYRYTDAHLKSDPISTKAVRYWFPVDIYIGGVEHAVLHLIYMRFFAKVMRDLGLVSFDEPVRRLFTQGMVLKDGTKMSKSRGNIVEPDEIIRKYGADTLRLFIQFCAPPAGDLDWNEKGLQGCSRFLNRFWRLLYRVHKQVSFPRTGFPKAADRGVSIVSPRALLRKLHQSIRKVTFDLERFHQNTAIATIMELLNSAYEYADQEQAEPDLIKEVLEAMTLLLSPFVPHMAEEVWMILGHRGGLSSHAWPQYDPTLAEEEEVEIVAQVNGRVRSRFSTSSALSQKEIQAIALEDKKIQAYIKGRTIRKIVVVPQKLVNIVTDP